MATTPTTEKVKVLLVKFKGMSTNGNPSQYVTFQRKNGEVLTGYTKANAPIGSWMRGKDGKSLTLTWARTTKSVVISNCAEMR